MLNDVIEYCGIITIQNNIMDVKRNMIPNLKSVGLNNIEIFNFPINSSNNLKNDGNTKEVSIFDLIHKNTTLCNDLCTDLFHNHLHIIKHAYNKGYNNVLVCEDDARFIDIPPIKLQRITFWMKNNEWDILYFGAVSFPYPIIHKINFDIGRCDYPAEAHSYVLSRDGMRKILKCKEVNHFDFMLQKYLDNKYMCVPSVCNQNKPPALYLKLIKRFGLKDDIDTYNIVKKLNNDISVIIPYILVIMISYLFYKHIFKF
jgi:hypothetical protein